jgi:hypothetical protein
MLMVRGGANETLTENGGQTPLRIAIAMNKNALVAAWEGISIQATAARKERERQVITGSCIILSMDSSPSTDSPFLISHHFGFFITRRWRIKCLLLFSA